MLACLLVSVFCPRQVTYPSSESMWGRTIKEHGYKVTWFVVSNNATVYHNLLSSPKFMSLPHAKGTYPPLKLPRSQPTTASGTNSMNSCHTRSRCDSFLDAALLDSGTCEKVSDSQKLWNPAAQLLFASGGQECPLLKIQWFSDPLLSSVSILWAPGFGLCLLRYLFFSIWNGHLSSWMAFSKCFLSIEIWGPWIFLFFNCLFFKLQNTLKIFMWAYYGEWFHA